MFTALHPEKVANLILLAAGIDFATRDGLINIWTDPKTFDVDAFVDAFGNCPAEFLQGSFLMLKPIANLVEKPIGLIEHVQKAVVWFERDEPPIPALTCGAASGSHPLRALGGTPTARGGARPSPRSPLSA